jgi:succinate-semialdehyde dehydrogenase / glutarate-semialdehyde dehydrogenase
MTPSYQSVHSGTGKQPKGFEALTLEALETSLEVAQSCFKAWSCLSYAERAAIVNKAAELMQAQAQWGDFDKLAALETDTGSKAICSGGSAVHFSAEIMAYYGNYAKACMATSALHPKAGGAHMQGSPIGVLFCVEPWSFPYFQLVRVAGPLLLAGNTLVVKHFGCVQPSAIAFEQLLRDAGAPVGAYTNLLISSEQCNAIMDDPRIKGVALTGRMAAGRAMASAMAPYPGQNFEKSSMELGGSDVFMVLDDADIDKVIPWAVGGGIYNADPACCSAKRFIVLDRLVDAFVLKFTTALAIRKPDKLIDKTSTYGLLSTVSTDAARVHMLAQVDIAVKAGARFLIGCQRMDQPGFCMPGTILTDISPDNPAFRDDFGGAVVALWRVNDEAAALALAHDFGFDVGGLVWVKDAIRSQPAASHEDVGMVCMNTINWSDAEQPCVGINNAGCARELSNLSIQKIFNQKLVRTGQFAAPI